MKIAILTDTYAPQVNGVVVSIDTFADEFRSLGHEVIILAPMIKGKRSTEDVWRFPSVPFLFQKEYHIAAPLQKKLLLFKKHKFDVIHIQTPLSMGHLGLYLSWRYRIPNVYTYHTLWSEYFHYLPLFPKKIGKELEAKVFSRRFCKRCDRVVVPTKDIEQTLKEHKVETPMQVIPTGIQIKKLPLAKEEERFRKKWNIDPKKQVLVYVGRLALEKNIEFLIESYERIRQQNPRTHLVIGGDGPKRKEIQKLCKKKNLDAFITFTGYLEHKEVFVAYSIGDLQLFPSKSETQGISLIEGLFTGAPAICIQGAPAVTNIIEQTGAGVLTQDSVSAYAKATVDLLADTKRLNELSKKAKQSKKLYSSKITAQKLLRVYEQAIAHPVKRVAPQLSEVFPRWK